MTVQYGASRHAVAGHTSPQRKRRRQRSYGAVEVLGEQARLAGTGQPEELGHVQLVRSEPETVRPGVSHDAIADYLAQRRYVASKIRDR